MHGIFYVYIFLCLHNFFLNFFPLIFIISDMTKLTTLQLNNNDINLFPHFPHMKSLQYLHLGHNFISYVGEKQLLNLTALAYLYLDHNEIEAFEDVLDVINPYLRMNLTSNPWDCTCHSYLFVLRVRERKRKNFLFLFSIFLIINPFLPSGMFFYFDSPFHSHIAHTVNDV